jgi:hypothetical protein
MTIDDLHQAFRVARHRWLTEARAVKESWNFYGFLEPIDFIEKTSFNVQYIGHQGSRNALIAARAAAKVLLIAEEQGLNKAMIWKLSN